MTPPPRLRALRAPGPRRPRRAGRCARRPRGVGSRCHGDAGIAGGGEVLPFGVLTFVVGALLIANAWAVVDATGAAAAAAREAARTLVEAPDPAAAWPEAQAAGRSAAAGHGRDPDRLVLSVQAPDGLVRCGRIVVEARYPVPAVRVPWVGGIGGPVEVRASHSELVDPYRDGLPAGGGCG